MNSKELLKKYPKTTEKIKEWHLNKLKLSINDPNIDEEFKKQLKIDIVTNDMISQIIDSNPHAYFEFFDDNDIYARVLPEVSVNIKSFTADIYVYDKGAGINKSFNKRIGAERAILERMIEILEEEL